MKTTITITVIAILLSACSQAENEVSTPTASSNNTLASNYEKEGIVCVKKSGPIEVTTYLGLVKIDNLIYTGLRTEKLVNLGNESKGMGSTLLLDDGNAGEVYIWTEAGVMTPKNSESAFPPSDIDTSIMMAKHSYGECKNWKIDSELFQRPES